MVNKSKRYGAKVMALNDNMTLLDKMTLMSDQIKMVEQFHNKFNVPVLETPGLVSKERSDLRFKLMDDEVEEYRQGVENQDLENIAKELADVLYACYGAILEHGLQNVMPEVFKRVHDSNMSKDYSKHKMVKGKSYFEADLSGLGL